MYNKIKGVVCGITTLLLSSFGGGLTSGRVQAILLMSISVGCCNAINMIVMEVGEWRVFDGHHGHGHHHGPPSDATILQQESQEALLDGNNNASSTANAYHHKDSRKDTMYVPAMEPDPFTAEVIKSLLSYGTHPFNFQ